MGITCKVDMTGFNRGFKLAMEWSSRTPSQAANFAGKEVAWGAYNNTPVTTPQRVNSDLAVVSQPKIGKRGKIIKGKQFRPAAGNLPPFAALLVNARVNPGSNYNKLTAGRYALSASPFKGLSREAGRAAMAAMIDVMVKGRRRSANGFLRAGWLKSAQTLKSLVPSRYSGSNARIPSGQNIDALGSVKPAEAGKSDVACVIENDVGLQGQNAASHNKALQQIGGPALQRALDNEGRKQFEYFLKKSGREELEIPVNAAWS